MHYHNLAGRHVNARLGSIRRKWFFPALCASLLSVGCASMGTSSEEQVRKRAIERWHALIKSDFIKAYGFSTSGFRAVVKPESFPSRMQGPVVWLGAEVVSVTCPEPVKCMARVRIDHRTLLARGVGNTSTHVDETWLLEEKQWWIFMSI